MTGAAIWHSGNSQGKNQQPNLSTFLDSELPVVGVMFTSFASDALCTASKNSILYVTEAKKEKKRQLPHYFAPGDFLSFSLFSCVQLLMGISVYRNPQCYRCLIDLEGLIVYLLHTLQHTDKYTHNTHHELTMNRISMNRISILLVDNCAANLVANFSDKRTWLVPT